MPQNFSPSALIVDRDERLVVQLAEQLEAAGLTTYQAVDGNVATAIALVKQPSVVVLAANLPNRSGLMVMEYLLQRSEQAIPVVMLSNTKSERHRRYAELLGVADYILKPEQIPHIAERVLSLVPLESPSSRRSA